jgi:multiple sugar transport system substrate-binding protein
MVWSHYFPPSDSRTPPLVETFRQVEQATGVRITELAEPGAEYWPKRQAEHAAGGANVDVMINQTNWVLPGGLSGMFADHLEYMRRDKVDPKQYYQAELDSWAWKGKLWAIPYQTGGEVVLLNKKLFDARGVKVPDRTWTYDTLLDLAGKLNDPANGKFALDVPSNNPAQLMGTFMLNFGGKLLNPERNRALYGDDPSSVRGAEFDVDLFVKHRLAPTPEARATVPAGAQPIEVDMLAMEFNHAFRFPNASRALGSQLEFAPPPAGPRGAQTAVMWGNSWSIMALGKNREAAWQALKFLHTKEGVFGPQLGVMAWPPLIWAANSPQWLDRFKGTRIGDVVKVWETSGRSILVLPEGDEARNTMNAPLQRALSGQAGTRDAMRESAAAVNELFGRRPAAWT